MNIATLVRRGLHKRVTIQENGKRRNVSFLEAMVQQTMNKAAMGDLRALDRILRLAQIAEDAERAAVKKELSELDVESLSMEQLNLLIYLQMTPEERKEIGVKELKVNNKVLGDLFWSEVLARGQTPKS